jgi:hypothetical protein
MAAVVKVLRGVRLQVIVKSEQTPFPDFPHVMVCHMRGGTKDIGPLWTGMGAHLTAVREEI